MSSLMSTLTSVTSTHTLTLHDALPISAAGVPLRINHARGGSVARGGARLDAIVHAMPPDTVDGVLHVTEQGETISQIYGLRSNALRTLERAFGVLGLATLARRRGTVRPDPP